MVERLADLYRYRALIGTLVLRELRARYRGSFLGFLWCLVRLLVPGPSGRKRYNVLAALNAVSHEVIRVANHSYINAESVCGLLRQIAAAGLPRPITLVLDNARYQRCQLVQALARSLRTIFARSSSVTYVLVSVL